MSDKRAPIYQGIVDRDRMYAQMLPEKAGATYFRDQAYSKMDLGVLDSLLKKPLRQVVGYLRQSTRDAHQAWVRDYPLSNFERIYFFLAAVAVRNPEICVLAVRRSERRNSEMPPDFRVFCVLVDLYRERREEALALIKKYPLNERMLLVDDETYREIQPFCESLDEVAVAIAKRDSQLWVDAMKRYLARVEEFRKTKQILDSLQLDIMGMGLCALARINGIHDRIESPMLSYEVLDFPERAAPKPQGLEFAPLTLTRELVLSGRDGVQRMIERLTAGEKFTHDELIGWGYQAGALGEDEAFKIICRKLNSLFSSEQSLEPRVDLLLAENAFLMLLGNPGTSGVNVRSVLRRLCTIELHEKVDESRWPLLENGYWLSEAVWREKGDEITALLEERFKLLADGDGWDYFSLLLARVAKRQGVEFEFKPAQEFFDLVLSCFERPALRVLQKPEDLVPGSHYRLLRPLVDVYGYDVQPREYFNFSSVMVNPKMQGVFLRFGGASLDLHMEKHKHVLENLGEYMEQIVVFPYP